MICLGCTMDLVFVLDSYWAETSAEWNDIKNFVKSIVQILTIGPNDVQVGVITYQWPAVNNFFLRQSTDKTTVLSLIDGLSYNPTWNNLPDALSRLVSEQFTAANGARSNQAKVAVVVSYAAALSQLSASVTSTAQAAQAAGITLYAVGTSSLVSVSELQVVSSSPHNLNQNYFTVAATSQLSTLVQPVVNQLCPNGVTFACEFFDTVCFCM